MIWTRKENAQQQRDKTDLEYQRRKENRKRQKNLGEGSQPGSK